MSGSIAGACENPQAGGSVCESGGSAPGAKLAMTEAGQPGQRWLYTLAMDDVLGWGAAKGATIHSHSWGDDNTRYTTTSRGTDAYVNNGHWTLNTENLNTEQDDCGGPLKRLH